MTRHYHVSRHGEDDDPFVTADLGAAMDYAAGELDRMSDFETDGVTAAGEAAKASDDPRVQLDGYRAAYEAYVRSNALHGAYMNAQNIAHQFRAEPENRAPLYQGSDWEHRLMQAAGHTMDVINGAGSLQIWPCDDSDCPVDVEEED